MDTSIANYARFATRYSSILWDPESAAWTAAATDVDVGAAKDWLLLWPQYARQMKLNNAKKRFVLHLINAPAAKLVYDKDDNELPPPRPASQISVKLSPGQKAEKVWSLTAESIPMQRELQFSAKDGAIGFQTPALRFWNVIVIDIAEEGGSK